MSKETKTKHTISPLKLPKSVREKLPEAQKDYEKALKCRIFLVFIIIILFGVGFLIICL
jgi:hypothetical protein